MNINDNQTQNKEGQCFIDFCTTTFSTSGGEVANSYKCNQKKFSTSDIWSIQKRKRQFTIDPNIIVTGQ